MTSVRRPALAVTAALAALALLLARPAAAQGHDSAHGHHMAHTPITIPAGAGYTAADVEFMQGMIAHHGQAIYMSRLAAGRQADARVQRLATKIDQSQVAEIRIMQEWLARRGQAVPDTSAWRDMHMPGMLTAAELDALAAAAGTAFDRAYLELMIRHHEGALLMVKDLFATAGAAQEVDANVFANDVVSVQTAEIGAMRALLAQLPPTGK
ncbi:MAG TPA: DUF305 domain-containing protein [Gemmatimonadales bacterium]|nr:DUF305 domain-containing protein [Gemmatimonadales bacterium]